MKKNRIKISVIVPVYNAEDYIEDCIKALLDQSYPDEHYEIIMIDNNSNDASAEIIKQYPRIKLERVKKQGAYAARNRGIIKAKGAIIAFTDADCIPAEDWLQNIDAFMRNPRIMVVMGTSRFGTESLILSMMANYEEQKTVYVFSSDNRYIYYAYTNNMVARTELFTKLGLFQETRRGADVIFVRQIVDQYSCDAVCHAPDVRVRNMEITHLWDYFQKQYIYSKSYKAYHKIGSASALGTADRLKIFMAVVKKNRYSLIRSCFFFFILIIGAIVYEIGRRGS